MSTHSPRNTEPALHLRDVPVWIFDLDNTLYPASSRLFDQVDWNMTQFVAELLGVERDAARKVQKEYFRTFGTTMRGLMNNHGVDPEEFMAYVHDIDLGDLPVDTLLIEALAALPGRKVIYTNGSRDHADNITKHLGIDGFFEGCFDIIDAAYTPKPNPDPYHQICARHDIDPAKAVMVEDMARNLVPAADLGMTTVWVDTGVDWSQDASEDGHIHHKTDTLSAWLAEIAGIPAKR